MAYKNNATGKAMQFFNDNLAKRHADTVAARGMQIYQTGKEISTKSSEPITSNLSPAEMAEAMASRAAMTTEQKALRDKRYIYAKF